MAQKASADGVLASARAAAGKGPAPVHLWNPPFCGDLDMVIRRDGRWDYEGTPIGRPALVRLFASILKREGGRFYLVTPVEKVGITVEDSPFIGVDVAPVADGLEVLTNLDERCVIGPDHALRVDLSEDDTPVPYVDVRAGLEARLDRKSLFRLVDLGVEEHGWFGVRSAGTFFPVIEASRL